MADDNKYKSAIIDQFKDEFTSKTVQGINIDVDDAAELHATIDLKGNISQDKITGEAGTTVVGEKINVKDVDINKEHSISVKGNLSQETREGYNLINIFSNILNKFNVSVNIQNDGSFEAEIQDNTKGADFFIPVNLVANHDYTMKINRSNATSSITLRTQLYTNDRNYVKEILNISEDKAVFNVPSDGNYKIRFLLKVVPTSEISKQSITVSDVLLYEGTEDKSYEQYGASPSIEFPSPIKYVKGSFESYNLFNLDEFFKSAVQHSCTAEKLENGIKIDFEAEADAFIGQVFVVNNVIPENQRKALVPVLPNKDYTLFVKGMQKCYINFFDKDYISLGYPGTITKEIYNFTTPENCKYLYFRFGYQVHNTVTTWSFTDIMVVEGKYTEALPYKPYGIVNSQYDITMQNKNLCPPLNEWTLSNGAYIDDEGYIVLPNANSKADCYVTWNKLNNKFYVQMDTIAEIENSLLVFRAYYLDKDKQRLPENSSNEISNASGINKWQFYFPRTNSNTAESINESTYLHLSVANETQEQDAPYKFKNVTLNPYGYVDYIEHEQDTHYIDLPYKLAKLGEAKDHFNIDWHFEDDYKVVDKVWYVEEVKKLTSKELTERNNSLQELNEVVKLTISLPLQSKTSKANGLCTHLPFLASVSAETEHFYAQGNNCFLFVKPERLSSLNSNGIINFLNDNSNLNIFYELETPTSTEVTDETLKAEFEGMLNILPYEETNIVVSGDGTESKLPLVEFKYNYITESPSVPRPSDIKYVKGDYEVKVQNKNLWIPEIDGIGAHRCKVSLNNDEYIFEITGNDAYFGEVIISVGLEWKKGLGTLYDVQNVDYISIFVTNELFDNNYITLYDENKMSLKFSKLESNKTVYDVRNASYITLRIGIRNPVIGETYKTKIQLTYSDTPTDNYIPHQSQTVELKNLPEMYSNEDTIEVTYEDNNGYRNLKSARVKNAWGKYEFTGEENIIKNTEDIENTLYYVRNILTNSNIKTSYSSLSNYLKFKDLANAKISEGFNNASSTFYLNIKTQENTNESVKAWLKNKYDNGKPLTILYPLDTPIYKDIQDTELKNKLEVLINDIYTYEGINYVYSTSKTETVEIPMTLALNYKLSNRLKKAE